MMKLPKFIVQYRGTRDSILKLLIILQICMLAGILGIYALRNTNTFELADARSVWSEENVLLTSGYEVEDGRFEQTGDDPQLHITGWDGPIQSVMLYFKQPVGEKFALQLYYPNAAGGLLEKYSAHGDMAADRSSVLVSIPKNEYSFLRIDINADFLLEDILVSAEPAERIRKHVWYEILEIFILLVLAASICCAVLWIRWEKPKPRLVLSSNVLPLVVSLAVSVLYGGWKWICWRQTGVFYTSKPEFCLAVLVLSGLIVWMMRYNYKMVYWFIIFWGIVWIFLDSEFNIIDEGSHYKLIRSIARNHYYPDVYSNYEAVQGPVYYYLMAFLVGWLPEAVAVQISRLWGLVCLIIFGWTTDKLFAKCREHGMFSVLPGLERIIWLLLIANPCILIRFTRVSNECVVAVLAGFLLYLLLLQLLEGFDKKMLLLCTVFCACAFLTKATSVFLFVGIVAVCVYYHQWKDMLINIGVFALLVLPWAGINYWHFGALTAMEGHLEFVLPLVNPGMEPISVIETLINFFKFFFFPPESANLICYGYQDFEEILSILLLTALLVSYGVSVEYFIRCFRGKLRFTYEKSERRQVVFMTFGFLPLSAMVMHTVTSISIYANSLEQNRYYFLINGTMGVMALMGLSGWSKKAQKVVGVIAVLFCGLIVASMINSYLWLSFQQM